MKKRRVGAFMLAGFLLLGSTAAVGCDREDRRDLRELENELDPDERNK